MQNMVFIKMWNDNGVLIYRNIDISYNRLHNHKVIIFHGIIDRIQH